MPKEFFCRGWIIGTHQIELTYLTYLLCKSNIIAVVEGLIVTEYREVLSIIISDEAINA